MSAEAIRLINAAISVTTRNPIDSVDDASDEARFADLNYENMARTALVRSAWKFNRKVADCSLLPTTPDSDTYLYAWQLPDDFIGLRTLTVNGRPIDYHIHEDREVWTICPVVPKAVYSYRAPESIWPPDFKNAFTKRLEAGFHRVDEKSDKADDADAMADKMFSRAALFHSQEEATHEHKKYPLLMARRTGYAPLRR